MGGSASPMPQNENRRCRRTSFRQYGIHINPFHPIKWQASQSRTQDHAHIAYAIQLNTTTATKHTPQGFDIRSTKWMGRKGPMFDFLLMLHVILTCCPSKERKSSHLTTVIITGYAGDPLNTIMCFSINLLARHFSKF